MRKSILQNSKDMLHRSFNPAKCKISLRLAGSRLKLLRNKKEVQLKQMRREIAQLLESGQDQTARIRVEHVIREEKMMAAYDLLEIYSELIVARLPIIESQKNCPIDLKEAITSVVFASPRCGDVPELQDVKKHFTAKYGKEFTTAAIELRPQCGASRMLVEKLSAIAPDVQTKTKILSAIAEEHNVKWDNKPFEETNSVPPSDLLNGPSTLGQESKLYVETSHAQAPPNNNEMYSSPLNFSRQDLRTSLEAGKLASGQNSGVSEMYQPEARLPGDERWNLEFKDAASAAQAAAESAERASIAARAAAQHATRDKITKQNSSESHELDSYILKDDEPHTHPNSQFPEEPVKGSSSEHVRLQKEKIIEIKPNNPKTAANHEGSEEYNQSASVKSKASIEVSKDEMSSRKNQSLKYEAEMENAFFDKDDYVEEERIGKQQPSISRSGSHSSVYDDLNIFANNKDKILEDNAENPFALGIDKGHVHGEASETSSHEPASQFFDRYDSYGDDHGFDLGPSYDEPESPERLSVVTDSWSPKYSSSKIVNSTSSSLFFARENSSNDFPENLTSKNGSEPDNFAPVTFDDSESDEEMKTKHNGMEDTGDFLNEHSKNEESIISSQLKDKGKSVESPFEESRLELNDTGNESGPEMEQRLNFDKLTGGIRHKKGYNRPSFLMNQLDKPSPVEKENEETTETDTILDHKKSTIKTPNVHSLSDSDSSEEEASLQNSSDEEDILYTLSAGKEVKTKSTLRASNSIFGSDNSDLDEDPPKQSVTRKSNLLGGISRRTKGPYSNAGVSKKTSSYISENPKKSESQTKNSNKWENYDQPTSENVDNNPETHGLVKATNSITQESEIEGPSFSCENPKTLSNEDESTKKASHVHPKLPDYDSLLQSLRTGRS